MEIVQIVIIGLCATIFILILEERHKVYGLYIGLAVGAGLLFIVIDKLEIILEVVNRINGLISIDEMYLKVMFQILGIAFITEFGAQLCKDAGKKSIASNIELAGKVIILVVSLPILLGIIEMIEGIV